MFARLLSLAFALTLTAGCTWNERPDGGEAAHSVQVYEDRGGIDPLDQAEIIEPLDGEPLPVRAEAPVDLTQPAPTTGTDDTISDVEEALTPGN